ncbi:MAG: Cof-type HAD-IIB family hydrolase [Oscillospiraceae bacterium]
MGFKLVAIDIDGTLVNRKKEITHKTKSALMALQKSGVRLAIATGRPPIGAMAYVKELELEKYGGFLVAYNGASVIDCANNEAICAEKFPPKHIKPLYDISQKYGLTIMTYEGDTIISENCSDQYLEIEARINGLAKKQVNSIVDYVDFDVPKCIMLGDGEYLASIEDKVFAEIGDDLNAIRSEPIFLEIVSNGIDKAFGLAEILRNINAEKDQLIAFGDGFNDRTMIEFAGVGVAMGNAQDVVKKVADFVTLSNQEDGIAFAIEKYFQ